MTPIRVMIVEDHMAVRDGLALMLRVFDDLTLVGAAENGTQAVAMCAEANPDVILMDLVMPEMNGIQATRAILDAHPNIRIVALTSFEEEKLLDDAYEAGVVNLLAKNCAIDELAQAIHNAYNHKP